MKISNLNLLLVLVFSFILFSCSKDDATESSDTSDETGSGSTELHAAFQEFDQYNVDEIYLEDGEVVITTNGWPNHTSPYWPEDNSLYIEPTVTSTDVMSPGDIEKFNGSYTLRVPASPVLASNSSSTGLGAIGIAVSGAVIYNDEEGPNVPLESAIPSLDYTGAHTGPQSYHYHIEPKAWTNDDDKLVGIISDGFFVYGRKCNSTGTYPEDLDESGGHTHTTQHGDEDEYHYHIQNEPYLGEYYIIFPDDYQGTPNAIQ